MDNARVLAWIVGAIFLIIGSAAMLSLMGIKPIRLLFRIYFGAWPEKDEHLKGLVKKRYVEPRLRAYAQLLKGSYDNQNDLLRDIRDDRLSYSEAKKRLFRSYREILRAKRRFERAQETACRLGFARILTYDSYLPQVKAGT